MFFGNIPKIFQEKKKQNGKTKGNKNIVKLPILNSKFKKIKNINEKIIVTFGLIKLEVINLQRQIKSTT